MIQELIHRFNSRSQLQHVSITHTHTLTHTHTHSHKANWQRLSTNEEHVPQAHEWLIFSEWQDKTPLDMKSRGFRDFSTLIVWENLMNQTKLYINTLTACELTFRCFTGVIIIIKANITSTTAQTLTLQSVLNSSSTISYMAMNQHHSYSS